MSQHNYYVDMSTVRVVDLIGEDIAGKRAQVRTYYDRPDWRPAWRTLRKVEQKIVSGTKWVFLRWEPLSTNEMEHLDCGYSGRTFDAAENWQIEVDDEDL